MMDKILYNPDHYFAHPDLESTVEITIINVCEVLDEVNPGWTTNGKYSYEEEGKLVMAWAEEYGAAYYAAPSESFFLREAAKLAYESGRSAVIVEDLS
jgi:hypothetical protein